MKTAKAITKIFISIVFIFSFVLLAIIWCWGDGHKLVTDIYLPAGQWNDEVFYYKQISSMIKYGIPQGYFGYNEMTAEHLTFGAWGIALLIPYYLLGKLVGWNLIMPIICNLVMMTISLGLFLYWVRPTIKQMLMWLVLIAAMPIVTRYIISGMVESVFFSAMILIVGIQQRLEDKYSSGLVILLYLLIGFLTLARPYMIIFAIIPFVFLGRNNKRLAAFFTFGYCIITMILYYFVNIWLCSPYIGPIINMDFIEVLHKQGFLSMIWYLVTKFASGWKHLGVHICNAFKWGGYGEIYVLFMILLVFIVVSYICKKQYEILFAMLVLVSIICAVILFYAENAGSRHILIFLIYAVMMLILKTDFRIMGPLSVAVWISCLLIPKEDYIYQLPYNDKVLMQQNERIEQELSDILVLENKVGWENTVDWVYNEDYSICYFIPDGFGINICLENAMTENIMAKYVLVRKELEIQKQFEGKYMVQWESKDYVLYCREMR